MKRAPIICAILGAALLVLPAARAHAQTDVIRGRVSNTEGLALQGVRVTATSIPGAVTREARTDNRGNFQIVFPDGTGDYMMGFALIGYVYRQHQVKRLADEDVLVSNATLDVVPLDTIVVVESVRRRVNRNSDAPDVGGTEQYIDESALTPDQLGDIAAMAASLPGVLLVPGSEGDPNGFSVFGLDPSQNSVTLDGMPIGTDGLPRDASVGTSLTTSPYDVSRGGFSGANFNISTGGGSNFRTRGTSLVLNAPQMMWTDRAGRSLGSEYTNVSLGGRVSGPLVYNKAFYNVSYQLGRRSSDNSTLLASDPLALQTAGVNPDSVTRLINILQANGVPGLGFPGASQRLADNGSVFGTVTVSPPSSTSGQSFSFTGRANWSKQSPVFGSTTMFPSASGDRTNWSGGLQGRHTAYLKMLLTETSLGVNLAHNAGDPYLTFPMARVRVASTFPDGSDGVRDLTFGGNQSLFARSSSTSATLQNTLSWFDENNRHRVKLSTELQYSGSRQDPSSNLLGTFTFNSLEDLEDSLPGSFTRTLYSPERSQGQYSASLSLGDSYRRTQDFQLQYGVRLDATAYAEHPAFNPAVLAAFGRRNDDVPMPLAVSPRIGFSWTVGRTNEIMAFFGQARRPRAVVRGGIGLFTNSSSSIGSAIENTGLPGGTQQIQCVGPAVPVPDWDAWGADPSLIPTACADGTAGTPFSNDAPDVSLFAPDYTPQRTLRSNLSWSGEILDGRFSARLEGTYSLNMNQRRTVDLNFDGQQRFTLDEGNRPVFVDTGSIVRETGAIASSDARVSQSFAQVLETRSDLQSRTAQLSVRLSPIQRRVRRFGWSGAYTYTHIMQQVSGFSSTAGNPLAVEWARASQGPHQISYNLFYRFFDAVTVNWNGQFRSGASYTPMVAGDINGDGYSNDRAFIYGAGAPDPVVADGMAQLLANSSGAVRDCLARQTGTIAGRNSCQAPWSSSASLGITLDRAKFHMPQRASISLSVSNPLGAADLLINGSDHLRGWGSTPSPDQSLLYVRGFDPDTRRYQYEVNQRFGATRPQFMTLRSPVVLTLSARFDLGPTRERQQVERMTGSGRTLPGRRITERQVRASGPNSLVNPLSLVLREQDTLQLSAQQADSIAAMNRRYSYRADSIWVPVGRFIGNLGATYDVDQAYDLYIHARRAQVDLLRSLVPAVNDLLDDEQRRRLPPFIVQWLDPRYLRSIRNGTNTFVSDGAQGDVVVFRSGEVAIFRR